MTSKPWKCREGYRCLFGDREGARRPPGGSLGGGSGGTTRDEISPSYYAYHQQQQQQQINNDSSDMNHLTLQLPCLGPFSISVLLLSLAFISKLGKLLFTESSPPKTSRLTTSKVSITTIGVGIGMTLLVTAHTALAVGSGDSSNVGNQVVGALVGQMYSSSKSPSMKKVQRRPFEDITNHDNGEVIETSNLPGVVILGITIKHDDVLNNVLASFRKKYSSDKLAWEAACSTYRPERPTNDDDSIDDDGSDHGDLNDDTTDESFEDALSKAIFMMENTKKDLASEKKDKGPVSEEEDELWCTHSLVSFIFLALAHQVVDSEKCVDGEFIIRQLSSSLAKEIGQYRLPIRGQSKSGCTNNVSKGMGGRMLEQIFPKKSNENDVDDDSNGESNHDVKKGIKDLPAGSGVYTTLDESLDMLSGYHLMQEIATMIAETAHAFQGHKDQTVKNHNEVANFLFEFVYASIFSGNPYQYVLEKIFTLGSIGVRNLCQLPAPGANDAAVNELRPVRRVRVATTWATRLSSLLKFMKENDMDKATIEAVESMIHERPENGFHQWDMICRLCSSDILEEYEDALPYDEGFEAVAEAAKIIDTVLKSDDSPEKIESDIRGAIELFEGMKRYLSPVDKKRYTDGCDKVMDNLVEQVISSQEEELIMTEKALKDQMSPEARTKHFPSDSKQISIFNADGSTAGIIYRYVREEKVVRILVTASWHVVRGENNTTKDRTSVGRCYIGILGVFGEAGIQDLSVVENERKIMLAFFIVMEGYSGDIINRPTEKLQGSFHDARRSASPNNSFKDPIRAGVLNLTRAISPDIVDTLTTVCLVAVLGIDTFSSMMKVLGTTVGHPFPCWLLDFKRLEKNQKQKEDRAKKRKEVDRIKNDVSDEDRSEEEKAFLADAEEKRLKNLAYVNERSEKKRQEVDRIKNISANKRSEEEKAVLADVEEKRLAKNQKENQKNAKNRQERMKDDEEYAKKRQRLDAMPTKQCSQCLKNKKEHSFYVGEWDKEGDRQCKQCIKAAAKVNAAPIASSEKTADIQLQSTDLAPELSKDMPSSSNDTIRFAQFHISQGIESFSICNGFEYQIWRCRRCLARNGVSEEYCNFCTSEHCQEAAVEV